MSATESQLDDVVLDLFASVLNLDRRLLNTQLTIEELGVDSLDVLKLTYAIEKQFKLNLSTYSHSDISSIERLMEILRLELKRQAAQ